MILVDSNVPMYLVGGDHPRKADAQALLERLAAESRPLMADAEVFHEILHRSRAIDRPEAIQPAFDVLLSIADEVIPIDRETVMAARDELLARWPISARDAIHVAVMRLHGIETIMSFDRGFDSVPGIRRLGAD